MSLMASTIRKTYENRSGFLVFALTGRTGNGCTTLADLLLTKQDGIEDLLERSASTELPELRRSICNNYIRVNWSPFVKITISDIITSFILELSKSELAIHIGNLDIDQDQKTAIAEMLRDDPDYDAAHKLCSHILRHLSKVTEDSSKGNTTARFIHTFFDEILPGYTNKLRTDLDQESPGLFVTLYQKLGDAIRQKGGLDGNIDPTDPARHIFTIPERVNKIIKLYRQIGQKRFVIDAIRNPLEAAFFQERYSSFYLIAVHASKDDRTNRLAAKGLTQEAIQGQANVEEQKWSFDSIKNFMSQNIPECYQKADVHIANENNSDGGHRRRLFQKAAMYVALAEKPGIITPSDDERLMQTAVSAMVNSGCISRQVGAVVVGRDGLIRGVGWNDVPQGQTPCLYRNANDILNSRNPELYSDFEKSDEDWRAQLKQDCPHHDATLQGRNLCYCFKSTYNTMMKSRNNGGDNQVHTRALHAEENAFLQISRSGGASVDGGTLYSTASPCELCAKKAYHLGIRRIVYIDPYPGIATPHIFSCGSRSLTGNSEDKITVEPFQGAVGSAYHQLYHPIMSPKDELAALKPTIATST